MSSVSGETSSAVPPEDCEKAVPHVLIVTRHDGFASEASAQLSDVCTVRVLTPSEATQADWRGDPDSPDIALVDSQKGDAGQMPLHRTIARALPDCSIVLVCTLDQAPAAAELMRSGEIRDYVLTDSAGDERRLPLLIEQIRATRLGGARRARNWEQFREPGATRGAVKQVLVVDDVPVSGELAKWILERHGYRVCVAETADRAKQYLNQHTPQLVLMDVHLGHVNGVNLVAAEDHRLPVVRLAGAGGAGHVEESVVGHRRPPNRCG